MSRAVQQRSADTELEASLRMALFFFCLGLVRFEKKASGSSLFLLNPYIIWPSSSSSSSSSSGWRAATKTEQEGAGGDGEWQTDSRKWGEKEDFSQAGRVFLFKVAEGHTVTNCCYCNNRLASFLSSFGPPPPAARLNYICFCVCVCASGRISTEHLTRRAVRPAVMRRVFGKVIQKKMSATDTLTFDKNTNNKSKKLKPAMSSEN